MDEDVEITPEMRVHILNLFYSLEHLNNYELLGVKADAERTEIKTHYFDAVSKFHPDRYFGKELGNYKDKLATVFQRLTEAHEALARKRNRAEYDSYLKSRASTTSPPKRPNTLAAASEVAFLYERMAETSEAKSHPPPVSQTAPPGPLMPEAGFAIPPQSRLPNISEDPKPRPAASSSPVASPRAESIRPRWSRAP
ncbi:MAG: DnaJ domain-containing protein, partial [Planctomycetes bacterium]|nr:DnaJ domain-containing protein [Planctomycetota bacterium]